MNSQGNQLTHMDANCHYVCSANLRILLLVLMVIYFLRSFREDTPVKTVITGVEDFEVKEEFLFAIKKVVSRRIFLLLANFLYSEPLEFGWFVYGPENVL